MPLLVSGRAPVRFQPPGSDCVYLIQVPTPYSWANLVRAVRARRAVLHSTYEMARCLGQGVRALWPGEDAAAERTARLADIDAYLAALDTITAARVPTGEVEAAEYQRRAERFGEIGNEVRRDFEPLALLEADNEFHTEIQALAAVRLHLLGVETEGASVTFPQSSDGITEEALATLPPAHIYGIWRRLSQLRHLTEAERKNSGSPSPGSPAPPVSPSPAPSDAP